MDKQKYYITTAIAYTSGKPHIGNTYEVRVEKSCKFHINNYSRSDEFLAVRVCSVFVLFCFIVL